MQRYIGSAQQCPFAVTERASAPRVPHPGELGERALGCRASLFHLLAKERRRQIDATPLSWTLSGKVLSYLLIGWVDGGAFRHG